ncbi:hypothetical protein KBB96_17955 [Luteolibacter ambystomatis]|uniref:Uncharacterized protein n=1 Tax=Luteolibacter ambystomatis TaxID=2824561 RepID=A0A975IYY9_9BACT|nr:hypothetical protein [Luteolibacter ambystomatis]QUE50732.1 hypothetical protein KBB96_17955 [Luteolibacter ambystomatis]
MKLAMAAAAIAAGLAAEADALSIGVNFRYVYVYNGTTYTGPTIDTGTSDIIDGVPAANWNNMGVIDGAGVSPVAYTGAALTSPGATGVTLDYSAVNSWFLYGGIPAQTDPTFPYFGYLDDSGTGYKVTIHGLSSILAPGEGYRIRAMQSASGGAPGLAPVNVYEGADTTGTQLAKLTNPAVGNGDYVYGDTISSSVLTADTITIKGDPRNGPIRSTLAGLVIETFPLPTATAITWTGSTNQTWDIATTQNWKLQSDSSATVYHDGDIPTFDDTGSGGTISISAAVSPKSLTFTNNSKSYTLTGQSLQADQGLTKSGTGNVTLLNQTVLGGAVSVSQGVLAVGNGTTGTLAASSITLAAGTRLDFNPPASGSLAAPITNDSQVKVLGSGAATLTGAINGAGTVEISRAGTVTMTGAGHGSAFTVKNGATLAAMGGGWATSFFANTTRTIHVESGGTLKTDTHSLGGLGGALYQPVITLDAGATWTLQHEQYFDGGNLLLNGGTVSVAANDFRLLGGTLAVGASSGGSLITGNSMTVFGNATFDVTDGAAAADLTIELPMTESGGARTLTKTGAGTMKLKATSGLTGALSVNTGTLALDGSAAVSAAASVTVASGATLDVSTLTSVFTLTPAQTLSGTGTVNGNMVVDGGLTPGGGSTGQLNVTGILTLDPSSTYSWNLADWTGAAGTGSDAVAATSLNLTATPSNPVTITIGTPGTPANFADASRGFVLVSTTGGITGFDPSAFIINSTQFTAGTGTWAVQVSGNNLVLAYTAAGSSPYDTWIAGYPGLSDTSPGGDPDRDGLSNLVEFLYGTNPGSSVNSVSPEVVYDSSHNMTFAFPQTLEASAMNSRVEYSTNLSSWTTAVNGEAGISIFTIPNYFPNGANAVVVSLPSSLANGGKFFVRLKVTGP